MKTIEELNAIQKQWMELDYSDSDSRKREVFKLMESLPKSYITFNGTKANMIVNSSPYHSTGLELDEIKQIAPKHGARTDIAWNCAGEFINI